MTAKAEVIVDDRLATVLATVPAGHAGARTQYRQLLDLLGRTPPDFALPSAALERLSLLEAELSADERAQLLRATPGTLRHPGLILRLAGQPPAVAAAAIAASRLDDWQWSALVLELPLAARGHLRHRRDLGPRTTAVLARLGILDLGLPRPDGTVATSFPPPRETGDGEGIGAIVRRIEAFRRNREAAQRLPDARTGPFESAPRLPLSDLAPEPPPGAPETIRFASDAEGRIVWAEGRFAAMLAGVPLGADNEGGIARSDAATARALGQHRPLRAGRIELDGAPAIAGAWRIDAAPRFAKSGGGFLGYTGVLRRPPPERIAAAPDSAADRLRQLLHELRTPVNAIQGFAELIQQQIFGPTPHQYRGLAAAIAADSAGVLAGFEEIDRLVRLETWRGEDARGVSDLAETLTRLVAQLRPAMAARSVSFALSIEGRAQVAMAEPELERTLWRVLATLATAALPGEILPIALGDADNRVELSLTLPESLRGRDERELFAVRPASESAAPGLGLLGGGFALRLARAELRAAGGALALDDDGLVLTLPGLTPAVDANSPDREASPRLAESA